MSGCVRQTIGGEESETSEECEADNRGEESETSEGCEVDNRGRGE